MRWALGSGPHSHSFGAVLRGALRCFVDPFSERSLSMVFSWLGV